MKKFKLFILRNKKQMGILALIVVGSLIAVPVYMNIQNKRMEKEILSIEAPIYDEDEEENLYEPEEENNSSKADDYIFDEPEIVGDPSTEIDPSDYSTDYPEHIKNYLNGDTNTTNGNNTNSGSMHEEEIKYINGLNEYFLNNTNDTMDELIRLLNNPNQDNEDYQYDVNYAIDEIFENMYDQERLYKVHDETSPDAVRMNNLFTIFGDHASNIRMNLDESMSDAEIKEYKNILQQDITNIRNQANYLNQK